MHDKLHQLKCWNEVKYRLHARKDSLPTVDEAQIWWTAFGENVGVEINGKSQRFSRPGLIIKKLSNRSVLMAPLTSQHKSGSWYVSFRFRDKVETVALSQIRVMSVERLYTYMGKADDQDMKKVKTGFHRLYCE